jgi:maltose alpha-D-glucosyltransferase/alpha-amylase
VTGSSGRRGRAILVATDTYDNSELAGLRAPQHDVEALRAILSDPEIGNYDVKRVVNDQSYVVAEAIEEAFQEADPDEVLLVYFSCHGIKDDRGRLFLATRNTKINRLRATAIDSAFLVEQLDELLLRRVILLFDCCYGGAFSPGLAARSDQRIDVADRLGGRGRAVITSSNAMQYAFEDDQLVSGSAVHSYFTEALVKGLRTGEADLDGDGHVQVDELYRYLRRAVHRRTNKQTPTWSSSGVEGDLVIADAPRRLPAELNDALNSNDPVMVRAVIGELGRIVRSRSSTAKAAERALRRLADGDDPETADAALTELAGEPSGVATIEPTALAARGTIEQGPHRHPRSIGKPASLVRTHWFEPNPTWFREAVFYAVELESFYDATGDGCGDLRGLLERADYLLWLGINCLCLSPLFPRAREASMRSIRARQPGTSPSPVDHKMELFGLASEIIDHEEVNPDFGTVIEFMEFVDAYHQRGIRILLDFPVGFTSVDHPEFVLDVEGGRDLKHRWHMWSHDQPGSNTSWFQHASGNFYRHRPGMPRQPELNLSSDAVLDAFADALRFWLDRGIDGVRLIDLPRGQRSDQLVASLQAVVNEKGRQDSVILVDNDDWPPSRCGLSPTNGVVVYWPMAARILLSLAREDRRPVVEGLRVLTSTTDAPWAFGLGHSKPLSLASLSDGDCQYMLSFIREHTDVPLSPGIRSRLARVVVNNRANIELMFALLFTLPASPVLYYGDEIAMGNNLYLPGADGLRTPMQWSSDRNGGFSRADYAQLVRPPLQDPIFGYEAVNVEASLRYPSSLLRWVRRMVHLRKEHPVLARGDLQPVYPDDHRVLAFVRTHADERVLVVANLAGTPRATTLDLSAWEGLTPEELLGNTTFPSITREPYVFTLPARAYFILRLPESPD